jgi:(1->4)-alpha-D-glucan 1-alpha-D-glucosylmutase
VTDARRVPASTYRVQLREEFGFTDAAGIVPYLAHLGVTHLYCSPVLQAAPGSAHGYDVVDHTRLSDALGGVEGWRALVAACRRAGLGLVVDVVPNHMAVPTPEDLNAALWDVLAKGPESSYAQWFDIDWDAGGGKLLMPVLGRPLAECLRDGEIVVDTDAGVVRYFDHVFPLAAGPVPDDAEKLEAQHYRLAYWRVGNEELNYRRFFDVTTLIGLRVELPSVFDATHDLLLGLVRAGEVDGLRIDHPDGLADPGGYLERLRVASGGVWTVVEKILEGAEVLPAQWACDGTTGYDALAAVTGVLTDPAGEAALTAAYERLTGRTATFHETVEEGKRLAVEGLLPAEVDRLVRDLDRVRRDDLAAADFTTRALRAAVVELLVRFDVYRAYADDEASRAHIDAAVAETVTARPDLRAEAEWLGRVLSRDAGGAGAEHFVTRFEQTTGPAMAKGVEDTAFYRYHRLVALNEVGGDPGEFGRTLEQWHDFCARLARDWPATMTTLSTHDTKRSEDVRARLLVLAEIPDTWARAVASWRERLDATSGSFDDANTDYLLWQTLVGAHSPATGPLSSDRLLGYLDKATKEAKHRTSWTDPDGAYEAALRRRVEALYADTDLMRDIADWIDTHVTAPGRTNSLAQKLLQLTMPGVPDVYQGQELPDFSLVDPDNRRPVDYDARRAAIDDLHAADPKLRVTATALRLRRERPDSFAGDYRPVPATGAAAGHVVAFRRGDDIVTVATRLPVRLARDGGWRDTRLELPPGRWRDAVTGELVTTSAVGEMLKVLPVALLVREDEEVR